MGIVVVTLLVKTADADAPAAVLVPAHGFYIAGFHSHDRSASLSHHVVSQMLSLIAVGAGNAEIVVIGVGKPLGNGKKPLHAIFSNPDLFRILAGLGMVFTSCAGIAALGNRGRAAEGSSSWIVESARAKEGASEAGIWIS